MIARSGLVGVRPVHRPSGEPFANRDRFQHRAIGVAAAADIINCTTARTLDKVPESIDQVPGMDVVTDLLASIAEYRIGLPGDSAFREVGEKSVQHCAGVAGAGQAPAAKARGFQSEISTIFLNQDIGGELRGAKQAVKAAVYTQRL